MKKIFLLFAVLFTTIFALGYQTVSFAEDSENKILIKTIDNTEAIEIFKKKLPQESGMLSRAGFSENSYIGTPFSMEYQEKLSDDTNTYLFYFPIIRDGEIISYVEQTVMEDGVVSWATAKFFDNESDLTQLRNGNAYALVTDKNGNQFAVSDNDSVILRSDPDYPIDYSAYSGKETKIVNIKEPIDVDTSSVIPQTQEEKEIFENARINQKSVLLINADELGAINKDNRLFVPLRNIAELIGDCIVDWDSSAKAVYIKRNDISIKFTVGENCFSVNDEIYNLDTALQIYNDKIYIPLRVASEALGADIAYNTKSKNIIISY